MHDLATEASKLVVTVGSFRGLEVEALGLIICTIIIFMTLFGRFEYQI